MRSIMWQAKGSKGEVYDCWVKVDDATKTIVWMDCTCWNFINRRIKKSGSFSDIVYYATACKHLKVVVNALISVGHKIKEPRDMKGTDKCTAELRKFLMERSKGFCECGCGKPVEEVHRKIAKTNGGKYNKDNCVYLNGECHKNITYQPWHSSPGAKKC